MLGNILGVIFPKLREEAIQTLAATAISEIEKNCDKRVREIVRTHEEEKQSLRLSNQMALDSLRREMEKRIEDVNGKRIGFERQVRRREQQANERSESFRLYEEKYIADHQSVLSMITDLKGLYELSQRTIKVVDRNMATFQELEDRKKLEQEKIDRLISDSNKGNQKKRFGF